MRTSDAQTRRSARRTGDSPASTALLLALSFALACDSGGPGPPADGADDALGAEDAAGDGDAPLDEPGTEDAAPLDDGSGEADAPAVVYADPVVVTFEPSDEVIRNPERGFYRFAVITEETDLSWIDSSRYSLLYSYVRLDDYRDSPIGDALLERLREGLDLAREAGFKLVLRFAYNDGPYPDSEPDAPLSRVLEHIGQVGPILRDDEDVIALVQAGFVGAWGEWHTSTNGLLDDPADRRTILEALLDELPASRCTQIRYPLYKQEMYGDALTAETALDGSYAARVGHHNDCFLASDTDMGTYPDDEVELWTEYVAADTFWVPMGGETCAVFPPRSECASALYEMERLHYTWINEDYHPDVVEGWSAGGCREEMDRRLGYRLGLREATLFERARPGGSAALRFVVENRGWAAPFNPRPVLLVLLGNGRRWEAEVPGVDVRRFLPGESTTIDVRVHLPSDAPEGDYRLALWLPDASAGLRDRPEYAVRFADVDTWDPATGLDVLATVTLDDDAPGTRTEGTGLAILP